MQLPSYILFIIIFLIKQDSYWATLLRILYPVWLLYVLLERFTWKGYKLYIMYLQGGHKAWTDKKVNHRNVSKPNLLVCCVWGCIWRWVGVLMLTCVRCWSSLDHTAMEEIDPEELYQLKVLTWPLNSSDPNTIWMHWGPSSQPKKSAAHVLVTDTTAHLQRSGVHVSSGVGSTQH